VNKPITDGAHEPPPPKPGGAVAVGLAEAFRQLADLKAAEAFFKREIADLELKIHELKRRYLEGER
jgi:hypothetical protein